MRAHRYNCLSVSGYNSVCTTVVQSVLLYFNIGF
uniref:Uncharacterized protein n=1 Tax=Anguilla anguilla TaxID=7936 RepID=A0A0E9PDY1_ANGAN